MPANRPSSNSPSDGPSPRVAELEAKLAKERKSRVADNLRLEKEIQELKNLLLEDTEDSMDSELKTRVRRLEGELMDASEKLAKVRRKAAGYWIEKVTIESKATYSPFVSHRGAWFAAIAATAALLIWAAQITL